MISPYRENKKPQPSSGNKEDIRADLRCLEANKYDIARHIQEGYPVEVTRNNRFLGIFWNLREIEDRISKLKNMVGE